MRWLLGRKVSWMCLALCHCTSAPAAETAISARGGNAAQPVTSLDAADGGAARPVPPRMDAGELADRSDDAVDIDAGKQAPDASPAGGDAATADGGRDQQDTRCLERDVQLDRAGPFELQASAHEQLELWIPQLPSGCKAPVVHFANGTGASCSSYEPVLARLASHGFLAVCAETPAAGDGVAAYQAFEKVLEHYPDVAAHKLGSMGHEAGGQGAILALQRAEAMWGARGHYAGLAVAPTSGHGSQPPGGTWQDAYAALKSPMLIMSIAGDAFVPERWVADGYDALSDAIEAYWYVALAGTHLPLPHDAMQQLAVAWFRYQLLGDRAACAYFKGMPASDRWDERAAQHASDCQ